MIKLQIGVLMSNFLSLKNKIMNILNSELFFGAYNNGIKILFFLILFFLNNNVNAQNDTQQKHNEQVVIIGSTDPSVNKSHKINFLPEIPPSPDIKTDFKFVPINKYFYTPSEFTPIKPATFRSFKSGDIYNNIIKAGFGTRITPYIEFFHSQMHKGDFKLDIHLKSISTFGKIKDYTSAPSSNSVIEMGFDKYFKSHTLEFNTGYNYTTNRYFYQAQNPDTINTDSLKQSYSLFFFDMLLSSNYKNDKKLHHSIKAGTYYYFNKKNQDYYNKSDEVYAYIDFDLYKSFRVTDVLDYQFLGGTGKIEFYQNNGIIDYKNNISNSLVNNFHVSLIPYFKARYGIMSFKAGVNLAYLYNYDKSHFRVFPDINATVNLYPEYLEFYVGTNGEYKKNSYKILTEENPFTGTLIPDSWTVNKIRVFGGFRGNIAKIIGFNIELSWTKFEDDYFYIALFDDSTQNVKYGNSFFIENDGGNLLMFNTQLNYSISEKVNVYASYIYNSYTLDTLVHPFGKLLSQLKIGGSYLINGKFRPWLEIIYVGKRWANVAPSYPVSKTVELESFADINIGVHYYHNESLSAFLKITNLINNKYQYYYLHPNYGLEIMLGITYKF
jgi:hypothetical protein